jgi:capsular polysaccharide biosynthesis protein
MSLPQQIEAFRRARVVVGAHGAGLTNVLFCRPDTIIVEIFPEGGVHGSAFHRLASFLDFPYFYIVGERVETKHGAKNANNNDIRLSVDDVTAYLGRILRKNL